MPSRLLTRARWSMARRRDPGRFYASRGADLRWTLDTQLAHLGHASPARHLTEYGHPNEQHDPYYLLGSPCPCAYQLAPSTSPAPARVELVSPLRARTFRWWRGRLHLPLEN